MSVESMARKLRRQAAKRINQRLKQPKHSLPHRYPFKYRQTEPRPGALDAGRRGSDAALAGGEAGTQAAGARERGRREGVRPYRFVR